MKKAFLIIVALLVIGAVVMAGCTTTQMSVVGSWATSNDNGTETIYINDDGTGRLVCYYPYSSPIGEISKSEGKIKEASYDGTYTMIGENKYVFTPNKLTTVMYNGQTQSTKEEKYMTKAIITQISDDKIQMQVSGQDDIEVYTKI